MNVLAEIVAQARERLSRSRRERPPARLAWAADGAAPAVDFVGALRRRERINIIAEFKPRSPSAGALREGADVSVMASEYERGGAAAISVLTEPLYFGSCLNNLRRAREACRLPLLRKDFLIDPYQIDEARVAGADAVLVIVAALDPPQLRDLVQAARGRQMAALVEIHDERELEQAMKVDAELIGINQRNLHDLSLDRELAVRVLREVPHGITRVAESGLSTRQELLRLREAGCHGFLIGSHLMQADSPGKALEELLR